jgi:hypothetical protein
VPDSALPPGLRGKKHTDWPRPIQWVPRGLTAYKWGKPKKILGNQVEGRNAAPAPIGEAGSWQISYYPEAPWWAKITGLAFYAAYSGKKGDDGKFRHYRVGARYDDIDNYTTILSIASRKYTGGDDQDTST